MTIKVTFLIRRDTKATWESVNPILKLAEPALETDTNRIKYGDGVTPWNSLPYSTLIPTGGQTYDVLKKYSDSDFEMTWEALSAGTIPFTPTGNIEATDIQAAIAELDSDKLSVDASFSFLELGDTPDTYIDFGGYTPRVKLDGSGLEFHQVLELPPAGAVGDIIRKYGEGNGEASWIALTAGIVAFTPVGSIVATDVQGAIAELDSTVSTNAVPPGGATGTVLHKYGPGDGETAWGELTAGVVSFISAGNLSSTDVQSALVELDTEKQSANARLSALSDVPSGPNALPYFTAATTMAVTTLSSFGRSLIDDTDASIARTTLGITKPSMQIPTLNSPWINYGGAYGGVRYYKSLENLVTIEGTIQAVSGSPTTGVVLFTLAAGYRPPDTLRFYLGPFIFEVNSGGTVTMQAGDTSLTSLSSMSFYAA